MFAHLSAVATQVDSVEVEANLRRVTGQLDFPLMEPLGVPLSLSSALSLRKGQEIKVSYQWRGSAYAMTTQVDEQRSERSWLLRLPRDITRPDKRLLYRQVCHQSWNIIAKNVGYANADARLPVHDISAGGVSVLVSHEQASRIEDRMVSGVLLGPLARPMPIRFRVANVRTLEAQGDQPGCAIAGGPFKGIGLRPHQILAEKVAKLARPQAA